MATLRRNLLVAAGILLDSSGRGLLVANDWSGRGRVRYTLPGGTVEPGETALVALAAARLGQARLIDNILISES